MGSGAHDHTPATPGDGTTRRRFIASAGAGGAALMLGRPPVGHSAEGLTEQVRYETGFNDGWQSIEEVDYARAVAECTGRYLRNGIDWSVVEARHGTYDWSSYASLKSKVQARGLRIMPTFSGCPAWAGPRAGGLEVCSPEHDTDFGRFVVRGLQYFGAPVVTHAEIWNEPNSTRFGAVPANRFASLLQQAHNWIWGYNQEQLFGRGVEMHLISGGLAMLEAEARETAIFWKTYLRSFLEDPVLNAGFLVGVHPYFLRAREVEGLSEEAAAARTRSGVMALFDEAKQLTTRNLWVTEVGCSSRPPWNQRGQALALSGMMAGFNLRSRCRGVLVHRMYDELEGEPLGTTFYRYGICWDDESAHNRERKTAYAELRRAWLEQPV